MKGRLFKVPVAVLTVITLLAGVCAYAEEPGTAAATPVPENNPQVLQAVEYAMAELNEKNRIDNVILLQEYNAQKDVVIGKNTTAAVITGSATQDHSLLAKEDATLILSDEDNFSQNSEIAVGAKKDLPEEKEEGNTSQEPASSASQDELSEGEFTNVTLKSGAKMVSNVKTAATLTDSSVAILQSGAEGSTVNAELSEESGGEEPLIINATASEVAVVSVQKTYALQPDSAAVVLQDGTVTGVKIIDPAILGQLQGRCSAISHSENVGLTIKNVTCTEDGWFQPYCVWCHKYTHTGRKIPALGHNIDWHNPYWEYAPACGEDFSDYEIYRCTRCNYEKIIEFYAVHRSFSDDEVTWPTCENEGYVSRFCFRCPHIKYLYNNGEGEVNYFVYINGTAQLRKANVAALGHLWDEGTVTAEPTCVSDGIMTYTCTRDGCGKTKEEAVPATGIHTEEVIPAKSATCIETGLTEGIKCSVCGQILSVQEETAPLGHTWDEGKVIKDKTCTEKEVILYTCTASDCGCTKEEEGSYADHDWTEWELDTPPECGVSEGTEVRVCRTCREKETRAVTGHKFGDWYINDNINMRECIYCGERETDTPAVTD